MNPRNIGHTAIVSLSPLLLCAACDSRPPTPTPTPAPPSTSTGAPSNPATKPKSLDLKPVRPEPTYTLAIEKSDATPPTYTVVWTAKVNSGGWKMTTDSVLVEDNGLGKTIARVFTIVHEPQPDTVVTQAEETLTIRYDAGTKVIETAEIFAKNTVLDSKPTFPHLYSIVTHVP